MSWPCKHQEQTSNQQSSDRRALVLSCPELTWLQGSYVAKFLMANLVLLLRSSLLLRSWMYLAKPSDQQRAPVLICCEQSPTTRSAMNVSLVSTELWEASRLHSQQEAVAGFLAHSLGNLLWVGHCEIIPQYLDSCTGDERLWNFLVILAKKVFNRHNWLGPHEGFGHTGWPACQLWYICWGHQVTWSPGHTWPEELRGSHIHANDNLIGVACY